MEVRSLPVRRPISSCDKPKLAMQPLISMRGFNGIEVLALDVLDQRQFEHPRFGNVLNHDGHLGQPRELAARQRRSPGDDLISIAAVAARSAAE